MTVLPPLLLLLALLLAGCTQEAGRAPDSGIQGDSIGPPLSFSLKVEDERGQPISAAQVDLGNGVAGRTDQDGRVAIRSVSGPALALVSAPGHLTEPLPLGEDASDREVTVRLWSRQGDRRWALHAGGDVMFARRYVTPEEGAPLLPPGDEARGSIAVVADLARVFALGDLRMLNLETVVSDLPASVAYPRKRFILNSPPAALAGLRTLQPDVSILANNHARDYLDLGVARTLDALRAAGLEHTGASADTSSATRPLRFERGGKGVGVLAYTTVNGDFVNDGYPTDTAPIPPDLQPAEAWQYERRFWSFEGASFQVAPADRRLGSAWRLFAPAEADMGKDEAARAWASASGVYPELQDWVARRGHGGAAEWRKEESLAQIRALKQTSDLVVVNFHAGFQFQEAASASVRDIARAAIDAGADVVICHHPHVLQGFEYYKGRLIAYSLGNLVFEQNFLSTFTSAVLRMVFDGDRLLEAKLVPIEIAAYRPLPSVGTAARSTIRRMWERSQIGAEARRDTDNAVRAYLVSDPAEAVAAHLQLQDGVALIQTLAPEPTLLRMQLPPGTAQSLVTDGLTHARLGVEGGPAGIELGRDLFGWGHFEDSLADGIAEGGTHWNLNSRNERVLVGAAASGRRFLRLRRQAGSRSGISTRPVARVILPEHRLYTRGSDGRAQTADAVATYGLRTALRLSGAAPASIRVQLFHFDDSNPTEDPETTPIGDYVSPVSVPADGHWRIFEVAIPSEALFASGLRANAALVYFQLDPGTADADLDIDDFSFIEWRRAAQNPDRYGDYRFIRNLGETSVELSVPTLPLERGETPLLP